MFALEYIGMHNATVKYIYTPYITIKGKRVYRKGGGVFRIPIHDDDMQMHPGRESDPEEPGPF